MDSVRAILALSGTRSSDAFSRAERATNLPMLKYTFAIALTLIGTIAPCRADSLVAQLFPLSGEVRLRNTSSLPVSFVFYEINSPSGALNPSGAVWKSISDNYDVSGNGLVDPVANWTKIAATSTQLAEGVFSGPGGSLPALRSISLGQIWGPALYPFPDLTISIQQADESPVAVVTQFAVAGDYNSDGTVNQADYTIWRQNFGSAVNLDADGNLNGIVDAGDYVVWRNNMGLSLPGIGSGVAKLVAGAAVPEPTAGLLLISAAFIAVIRRGRERRAVRCG